MYSRKLWHQSEHVNFYLWCSTSLSIYQEGIWTTREHNYILKTLLLQLECRYFGEGRGSGHRTVILIFAEICIKDSDSDRPAWTHLELFSSCTILSYTSWIQTQPKLLIKCLKVQKHKMWNEAVACSPSPPVTWNIRPPEGHPRTRTGNATETLTPLSVKGQMHLQLESSTYFRSLHFQKQSYKRPRTRDDLDNSTWKGGRCWR